MSLQALDFQGELLNSMDEVALQERLTAPGLFLVIDCECMTKADEFAGGRRRYKSGK